MYSHTPTALFICIYIHEASVQTFVRMCVSVCVCARARGYMYSHIPAALFMCIYIHEASVQTFVRMCVSVSVCVCVRARI